mgnify:CR=1 FL=1
MRLARIILVLGIIASIFALVGCDMIFSFSKTVEFDSNGGSAVVEQEVKNNAVAQEPAAPTRTGYTFTGWYGDAGLTTAWDFTNDTVTEDITLYAGWSLNSYTVSYDSNGGSVVTSEAVDYNDTVTEPTDPTRTGYTFTGWYGDAGLTTAWDFTNDTIDGDTTLYADWLADTHTISFDSSGGSSVDSIQEDYDSLITKPADPTKSGYSLVGWFLEDMTTEWDFLSDTVSGDVTLYAKWEIAEGTLILTFTERNAVGEPEIIEFIMTNGLSADSDLTALGIGIPEDWGGNIPLIAKGEFIPDSPEMIFGIASTYSFVLENNQPSPLPTSDGDALVQFIIQAVDETSPDAVTGSINLAASHNNEFNDNGTVTAVVTKFGAVGTYCEATFSGYVLDSSDKEYDVSGALKILRMH